MGTQHPVSCVPNAMECVVYDGLEAMGRMGDVDTSEFQS